MAKNARFHIKSPVKKIFMVGPKGASHRGSPPKYATGYGDTIKASNCVQPMLKVQKFTAHVRCHVTCRWGGVKNWSSRCHIAYSLYNFCGATM